jgi:hypothetical protein
MQQLQHPTSTLSSAYNVLQKPSGFDPLDYFHHPLLLTLVPAASETHAEVMMQRLRTLCQVWLESGLWSIYNLVVIQETLSNTLSEATPFPLLTALPAHISRRFLHRTLSREAIPALLRDLDTPLRRRQHQDPDLYLPVTLQPEQDFVYPLAKAHRMQVCAPENYSLYHGYCDRRMRWESEALVKQQLMQWVFQPDVTLASVKPSQQFCSEKPLAKTFAQPRKHNPGPNRTLA